THRRAVGRGLCGRHGFRRRLPDTRHAGHLRVARGLDGAAHPGLAGSRVRRAQLRVPGHRGAGDGPRPAAGQGMSGTWIALIGFGGMLALIALRLHVGIAMFVTGCVGYMYLSSGHALFAFLKTNAYNLFASYTLSVIPLFILMGALAEQSGLSSALFRAAAAFMGQVRGGLAMAVIAA